jgi:hypothetical protein
VPDSRQDNKQNESKTAVAEQETKKPVVVAETLATLPNVIGSVTANILTALVSGDESAKGEAVKAGRRQIRMWYESQSVEDRKEIAKGVRRLGEQYKQVSEQLHLDIVTLAMQDL